MGLRHAGIKCIAALTAVLILLAACAPTRIEPTATATASIEPNNTLTAEQAATLGSLELVDDYPLYTMHYFGSYGGQANLEGTGARAALRVAPASTSCQMEWGCSLFAALGDAGNRLYGRNFDWQFSPAVLLFADPPDGYASVSMVDITYLGFEGDRSKHLKDLSLEELRSLLDAPWLPFDGMNEKGLVVGMAAVEAEEMPRDPAKKTIDHLEAIREMLDHAATVDEAIQILGSYNINMGSVPLHYLIASAAGDSALVEFRDGKMEVFRNESAWQTATNFLVSAMNGHPEGECERYDRMNARLKELEGRISFPEAMRLLEEVSQDNTQWSMVYEMTSGDVRVVMGGDYSGTIHSFHLGRAAE